VPFGTCPHLVEFLILIHDWSRPKHGTDKKLSKENLSSIWIRVTKFRGFQKKNFNRNTGKKGENYKVELMLIRYKLQGFNFSSD